MVMVMRRGRRKTECFLVHGMVGHSMLELPKVWRHARFREMGMSATAVAMMMAKRASKPREQAVSEEKTGKERQD